MPPSASYLCEKKPNKTDSQITMRVPQIQCFLSFDLLISKVIYTPDKNKSPENINEATPKPLIINKSLTQAPNLLSQFLVSILLEASSVSVL